MSQINIANLTFAYDGSYDNIFENTSFQIDTSWRLGFTGRNGRGKTTFLNLLLGRYEYQGVISASVSFQYFPYEVPDPSLDTLNVVETIDPDFQLWQLVRELSLLEAQEEVLYRPFSTLSNGEQTKVLLAALFLKENSFLLIDEPTNHLDMKGRELVSRYLQTKSGFILVSHDRVFLDNCVDHILSINKTNIEVVKGNFSSWWANKEQQDNFERAENEKLRKDIRRLSEAAKRTATWSDKQEETKIGTHTADRGYVGHMAAKMMKRSKAIENRREHQIEEKSKLLKNIESAESLKLTQAIYHADRLLSLEDVSIWFGEKTVCQHVSFTVQKGDRIVLQGKNGSGKSSLLKFILGEPMNYSGKIMKGSGLTFSYLPQDTAFLKGDLKSYARVRGIDESLFLTILRKLDFARVQFEKDMEDYSGGQKKKVLIAASLCEKAHLMIWDEPLNFIDVLSRIQIEKLLLEYQPTILFVEHDQAFCENIANKTVAL